MVWYKVLRHHQLIFALRAHVNDFMSYFLLLKKKCGSNGSAEDDKHVNQLNIDLKALMSRVCQTGMTVEENLT